MKWTKKRMLAIFLAAALAAGTLAGCGSAEDAETENTETENAAGGTEASAQDRLGGAGEPQNFAGAAGGGSAPEDAAQAEGAGIPDSADASGADERSAEYTEKEAMSGGLAAVTMDAAESLYGYPAEAEIWIPEPGWDWDTESYEKPDEEGFYLVASQPLSTFAADVDTASYANVRRMIENGSALADINPDAVRAEEFLNYFSYDLELPERGEKFGITTELSVCPWNKDHELLFIGMRTEDLDLREAPECNLVFLIDVSGSMSDDKKLPLLQKSFDALVDSLPERGTVSIVTYASGETVVLAGEPMANRQAIKNAIDSLVASGATNGERGIQKAYEIAADNFVEGGINRVVMATDGDLNVGISDPDELEKFIRAKKDDGVFLSVLGFGMGNYKDDRLERLADCGNGNYHYIDSFYEAKKVLIDEMGSTLVTVAKDVKLQVEFNPANVNAYRLIGYEDRRMDAVDFNDDTKDGGEIGAGHSVVALYEIIRTGSPDAVELKYQDGNGAGANAGNGSSGNGDAGDPDTGAGDEFPDQWNLPSQSADYADELATVKIRCKEPESDTSELAEYPVSAYVIDHPSENTVFAGLVAEFAMILSDSEHKGTATLEGILEAYKTLTHTDEYRDELYQLVRMVAKRG